MGRGKLKLELMRNEKSRRLTFKKRKHGLINKLHQLTTLCDVTACMIIIEAPSDSTYHEPEIWPRDPEKVRRIVESYKAKKNDSPKSESAFDLSDFFRDRTKTVDEELKKLRKSNLESKFPIRHTFLDSLTESQLREFGDALKNKARIAKSRIEFLKMSSTTTINQEFSSMDFAALLDLPPPDSWNLDHNQETASSSSVNQNNYVMMDFAHAPKRFGLDPLQDFCTWNNIHDQETDFASNNNHQKNSVMMMDFAPEILGFDPARDLSAWDFDEQEIDSCLKEISDASNFDSCLKEINDLYTWNNIHDEQETNSRLMMDFAPESFQSSLMKEDQSYSKAKFDDFEFGDALLSSINCNSIQQDCENLEEDMLLYNIVC